MAFPSSIGESNPTKKQAVEEWIFNNIDYDQMKQGFPLCFVRNSSFYLTELPNWRMYPEDFRRKLMEALIDGDMLEDLQGVGLINWCRTVPKVLPIRVPKDGNCLLHAISVAVWGIKDESLLLRRLLNLTLTLDNSGRFHSRWLRHRQEQISHLVGRILDSSTESLDQEWKEVSKCLDSDQSASLAVPHRFLESIHVYALSNILRRPIIVLTDPTCRTFSGLSLQDNDMGGIYLPLEWDWNNTSKTPVLIAYAQNHFCPLVFAEHSHHSSSPSTRRKKLAPIVTGKLEQLPVRFLLEGEEPEVWELLRKYLKVKETVMTLDGSVHNILCAEFETSTLPDNLNLVTDYFRLCEQRHRFQQQSDLSNSQYGRHSPVLYGAEIPQPPGPTGLTYEQLQQAGHRHQTSSSPQHARQNTWPQVLPMRQISVPLDIPPPNMFPPQYQRMPSEHSQESSLNPPPSKKCIVPKCKFYGDPTLGMMCSTCFKEYTVIESRQSANARQYERQLPTAPMPSIGAGGEGEAAYLPSMMSERCKTKCGFRASRYTYPYCHECYERLQQEASEKQRAEERLEVTGAGAAAAAAAAAGISSGDVEGTRPGASAPGLVSTTLPAPATGAQASASATSSLLEPFLSRNTPPVTSQAGRSGTPLEDLIQFQSMTGKPKSLAMTSPTQVLTNISLTAPLTPPDDSKINDTQLFGPGDESPTTLRQPAAVTSTQTTTVTSSQNIAVTGINVTSRTSNNLSAPSRPSQGTLGQTTGQCITEGCLEESVQNNRCGKCYVGMGLNLDPVAQKLKQISTGPASVASATGHPMMGQGQGLTQTARPQSGSPASSMPQLPNSERPRNESLNYISKWVQSSQEEVGRPSMGLAECSGTEELGGDLLATGEACHISGIKCVSPVCQNIVAQPGQLCQACQDTLRAVRQGQMANQGQNASQGQGHSSSVQESFPEEKRRCVEEGCEFFGSKQTDGYCSKHYSKAFKRQLAEETRHGHPANAVRTVPLYRQQQFINMTSELRPLIAPPARRGTKCTVPGCTFFGDPKQKDMCGKHYQEYISSIASVSNVRVNPSGAVSAPYFPQSMQQTASYLPPSPRNVASNVETAYANYMPVSGMVSVPPPSQPISETVTQESMLGHPVIAIGGSRSLDETYTRVTNRNTKHCITPGCTNYGNVSKLGLCNSCFEQGELVKGAILGEEECG